MKRIIVFDENEVSVEERQVTVKTFSIDRQIILEHVEAHFEPGEVYHKEMLEEWATDNGYIKDETE